ncbi:MAG TPA: hypothetical protein VK587_04025 [bacterium]|nr:hypothetical protein [bacterium]
MHRASAKIRSFTELPLYRETTCQACGCDEGLAIRYRGTALCVDCYREAKRADREPDRPLEHLVRRAMLAAAGSHEHAPTRRHTA